MDNIGEAFSGLMILSKINKDISNDCDNVRIKLIDFYSKVSTIEGSECLMDAMAVLTMFKDIMDTITKQSAKAIDEKFKGGTKDD